MKRIDFDKDGTKIITILLTEEDTDEKSGLETYKRLLKSGSMDSNEKKE